MAAGIGSTYARDTCINSTCAMGTWIGYTGVASACTGGICAKSASVGGVEPRALVGLGVTLVGLGLNNCCLQLFMGLIFALIEELCSSGR